MVCELFSLLLERNLKKFKFSDSGNLFAILSNIEGDTIQIYDSSAEIERLLSERIRRQKFIVELKAPEIFECEKVVFSGNDEYVYVGSNRVVLAFEVSSGDPVKRFGIPDIYGTKIESLILLDRLLSLIVQ